MNRDRYSPPSPEIKKWLGLGICAGIVGAAAGPVAAEAALGLGLISNEVKKFKQNPNARENNR